MVQENYVTYGMDFSLIFNRNVHEWDGLKRASSNKEIIIMENLRNYNDDEEFKMKQEF